MRRILSGALVLFMAMCLCLVSGEVFAAGKGKAKRTAVKRTGKKTAKRTVKTITLKGEINKILNRKGKLSGAKFNAENGKTYRVAMTKTGIKLAKKLHGKKAEIVASLARKGTKRKPVYWLRVRRFKEILKPVPEPEEAPDDDEDFYK